MFKNLFGPSFDEPLLYSFDRIVGLLKKFDFKLKRRNAPNTATNETVSVPPTAVIDETTTENVVTEIVTSTQRSRTIVEKSETSSHTSKQSTSKDDKKLVKLEASSHSSRKCTREEINKLVSIEVDEVIERREHESTPTSMVKKSSSMECNYPLSKMNVANRSLHCGRRVRTKKVNRYVSRDRLEISFTFVHHHPSSSTKAPTKRFHCLNAPAKGFGDVVEVHENHFERKMVMSNGRKRMESILKKETKQQNVISAPNAIKWNLNRTERCNKTVNELAGRKVIRTEWAITRIYTFDDDSQTYEVLQKDKVLAKNGPVKRIFAIAPNLTTVAYEPLNRRYKK